MREALNEPANESGSNSLREAVSMSSLLLLWDSWSEATSTNKPI